MADAGAGSKRGRNNNNNASGAKKGAPNYTITSCQVDGEYNTAAATILTAPPPDGMDAKFNKFIIPGASIEAIIGAVDSRHDFDDVSQDTAVKTQPPGERVPVLDCFKHFSNNMQRIVLNLGPIYSKKLTSSCKGKEIMRRGPEDDFLELIEILCGIPTGKNVSAAGVVSPTGFTKHIVKAADFKLGIVGERGDGANYDGYHKAIASILGWGEEDAECKIPLIVDTTRSLSHDSEKYFIICRNKECVADPSNTSSIKFPLLAKEVDDINAVRTYEVIGVNHEVSGHINEPKIKFTFDDEDEGTVYDFGGDGRKPNEIEVCKSKIAAVIEAVSKGRPLRDYQNIPDGSVKQLVQLFDKTCGIYDKADLYRDEIITTEIKRKIALPYIAKRAGDQLQVLSCKESIIYDIYNLEVLPLQGKQRVPKYDLVKKDGQRYRISNGVFWTIDRVAACFAILNDITTVLQLPTKDVKIYKKQGYQYNIEKIEAAQEGGADECSKEERTKQLIDGNTKISDDCFKGSMLKLCTPFSQNYNAFTLLNLIYYYTNAYLDNNILSSLHNLTYLGLDNNECIINDSPPSNNANMNANREDDGKQLDSIPASENRIILNAADTQIIHTNSGSYDIVIKKGEAELPINIEKMLNDLYKLNNVPNRQSYFQEYYIPAPALSADTFIQKWKALQLEFNFEDADQLFVDFIELLALCENKYFLHRDYADNFYAYDSKAPIRLGGHTQLEMVAFILTLIEYYKAFLDKPDAYTKLLQIFIHLPFLLDKYNHNVILTDLEHYIGAWFKYNNCITEIDDEFVEKMIDMEMFNTILNRDTHELTEQILTDLENENYYETLQRDCYHGIFVNEYYNIIEKRKTVKAAQAKEARALHKAEVKAVLAAVKRYNEEEAEQKKKPDSPPPSPQSGYVSAAANTLEGSSGESLHGSPHGTPPPTPQVQRVLSLATASPPGAPAPGVSTLPVLYEELEASEQEGGRRKRRIITRKKNKKNKRKTNRRKK
jgi:hypothetical protein